MLLLHIYQQNATSGQEKNCRKFVELCQYTVYIHAVCAQHRFTYRSIGSNENQLTQDYNIDSHD